MGRKAHRAEALIPSEDTVNTGTAPFGRLPLAQEQAHGVFDSRRIQPTPPLSKNALHYRFRRNATLGAPRVEGLRQ